MKKSLVAWILVAAFSFTLAMTFTALSDNTYAPFALTGTHGAQYYRAESIVVPPAPDYAFFGGSSGFRVSEPVCWLVLTIENEGDSEGSFNTAVLQIKTHPDGDWVNYMSGTDWDTATTNLPFCTTVGPQEVAPTEDSVSIVKLYGVYAWRLQCTSTTATTVANVFGRTVTYTSGGWD